MPRGAIAEPSEAEVVWWLKVCVLDGNGAKRLAGFEVTSLDEHEKGIVPAQGRAV